jgi:hypothetical protein
MAATLRACLQAWWAKLDVISHAHELDEVEMSSKGKAVVVSSRPEYSIMYLMYLLAQHSDSLDTEGLHLLAEPSSKEEEDEEVRGVSAMSKASCPQFNNRSCMLLLLKFGPCLRIQPV